MGGLLVLCQLIIQALHLEVELGLALGRQLAAHIAVRVLRVQGQVIDHEGPEGDHHHGAEVLGHALGCNQASTAAGQRSDGQGIRGRLNGRTYLQPQGQELPQQQVQQAEQEQLAGCAVLGAAGPRPCP